jgi:hypothetical protein
MDRDEAIDEYYNVYFKNTTIARQFIKNWITEMTTSYYN